MSATLHTLLEQAQAARDTAQAQLAQAEALHQRLREQAQQLQDYREDYRRRAPALQGRSASIELVRCHQGFMARLDQAIDQQRLQLDAAAQQVQRQRAELLDCELRLASVRKLHERREADQRRVLARREQNHSDEMALRLALARRTQGLTPEH